MRTILALILFSFGLQASVPLQPSSVLIVQGAPGEEKFGNEFIDWTKQIEATLKSQGISCTILGHEPETNDLQGVERFLTNEPRTGGELCLILLGHGTFDSKEAKFNLRGPDLSATALSNLLSGFERPVAVINGFSSSGPFLSKLSRKNRVIITATRSGHEQNYARFGKYFAESFGNPAGDLDKDGQTSLLESFLAASKKTADFYEREGRLATEHALLDDNGDGLGTQADWFRGVRVSKKSETGEVDGRFAHQFHLVPGQLDKNLSVQTKLKRSSLENQIEVLRSKKASLSEKVYYQSLEELLLELAKVYELAK